MKNKLFSFVVVAIVALAIGLFIGTKMVSPQLAPSSLEQEGQVVLMGTPGIFPDKDPILKTNFYANSPGAVGRIRYIQPDLTSISQTSTLNFRGCFSISYLDNNKKVIPLSTLGGLLGSGLCIGPGDSGFVLDVLKVSPGSPATTGRVIVTASQITQ